MSEPLIETNDTAELLMARIESFDDSLSTLAYVSRCLSFLAVTEPAAVSRAIRYADEATRPPS